MSIKINENIIKNATIPKLSTKYELALTGANFICDEQDGVHGKNSYLYELYKSKILSSNYLHITDKNILSDDDYIEFDYRRILSEMRYFLKHTNDKSLSVKTKKIMSDFGHFLDMLDTEIKNEIRRKNDILFRLNNQLQLALTPENLASLSKVKDETLSKLDSLES